MKWKGIWKEVSYQIMKKVSRHLDRNLWKATEPLSKDNLCTTQELN
jgi:hypothetical protein